MFPIYIIYKKVVPVIYVPQTLHIWDTSTKSCEFILRKKGTTHKYSYIMYIHAQPYFFLLCYDNVQKKKKGRKTYNTLFSFAILLLMCALPPPPPPHTSHEYNSNNNMSLLILVYCSHWRTPLLLPPPPRIWYNMYMRLNILYITSHHYTFYKKKSWLYCSLSSFCFSDKNMWYD